MVAEKKFIDQDKLSKAVKKFLIGLIEKGKDFVEITEFNAELHKIIEKQHLYMYVPSSFIHNSQRVGAAQISICK